MTNAKQRKKSEARNPNPPAPFEGRRQRAGLFARASAVRLSAMQERFSPALNADEHRVVGCSPEEDCIAAYSIGSTLTIARQIGFCYLLWRKQLIVLF